MDYSAITQELIEKRFSILPEKIRTVLDSEKNREAVSKICAENFLSEEQSLIAEQLTSLILLGLANQKDFQAELIAWAGLTDENAAKIADAIKNKILAQADSDLGRIFSPLAEPTANDIKTEAAKEAVAAKTPIDAIARPAPKAGMPAKTGQEPAPFVLYEDKIRPAATETRKPLNKPFSFSMNIFRKPEAAKNEVRAQIETPEGRERERESGGVKITMPRRTVHYSEFRTPVSPFGDSNITSISQPEKISGPAPSPLPEKPVVRPPAEMKPAARPVVSRPDNENVINLKDL